MSENRQVGLPRVFAAQQAIIEQTKSCAGLQCAPATEAQMSIFDTSLTDDEQIELVTLHSDISAGIGMTDSLRFPNVRAALDHARALSQDERDRTFIRCGQKVQTLEAAERLMSGAGQGDEVPLAPNLP